MPRPRWRAAIERLGRVKAQMLLLDQELLAILRDVEAAVRERQVEENRSPR